MMHRLVRSRLRTALALVSLVLLAACQEGAGTAGVPAIRSFTADDPLIYTAGGSTVLRWTLEGASGSTVRLISSAGGEKSVTGATSTVVTPEDRPEGVTYTLEVRRPNGAAAFSSVHIGFPTATTISGQLALDNLIDEANSGTDALVVATSSASEEFRRELAELLPLLPASMQAAGATPAAIERASRTVGILSRIVAPTSIYAGEAVVLVDAQGRIADVNLIDLDGSWSLDVPRFGTYVVLRGRYDDVGELICYQPLEVERRNSRGRALSVQPLLIRSTVRESETLGRFALNERSGHLSAVSEAVPLGVRIPDDLAAFFQISDQVLSCEHPNPAKLTIDADFLIETPNGDNGGGVLDFANLWTTLDDPTSLANGEPGIVTLGSSAIDDDGGNRTSLHYNPAENLATLPLLHDTCLLNFDKCNERFEQGEPILPFLVVDELAIDPSALWLAGVETLRTKTTVQTATVKGRALRANTGAAVANALILISNNETGSIGMGRSTRTGDFSIAVTLGGGNTFTAVSNIRGVGQGSMACGSGCRFTAVGTYTGSDATGASVNVIYR
jgi:hypothetical protein